MSGQWEARFRELEEFHKEHGHCHVPQRQGRLGRWVNKQRAHGKKECRRLGASRVQKLEDLGFRWSIAESTPETKLEQWEARFQELKEFKEKHGHCKVTAKYSFELAKWASDQRRFRKNECQHLNASRVEKLNDLGFQWRISETDTMERSDRWEARLQQLKEFRKEHGHCDIPKKHPGGLGAWVHNQRYGGKEGGRRCTAEQAQKLEELGFKWNMAGIRSDRWELRFRELKEFQEQHGHCNVPGKHPGGLGEWVNYQRRSGKKKSQRRNAKQAQKLEDLGFQWEIVKSWEARFQELKEFQEEHGHCDVPAKHPGGLGHWVGHQRRGGKEGSQRHNAERTQKLEELGFRWEIVKNFSWEERLQQLKEFQKEHGHCNVPEKHPGGLGSWVRHQRRGGKKESQGGNAERVRKLEELGFQWESTGILSDRWEARFQELKEFKEEHGHCNVPREHPGGLGNWVHTQRSKQKSQRLDEDRAQKLEALGFQWVMALLWEEWFQQLKQFKEQHGHCNVPEKHPGGLGSWVRLQRRGGNAWSPYPNAEQTKMLKELGLRCYTWEAWFQELKEFKEEHGHCDVPHKHPGGLGVWAMNQRRRGKEGSQRRDAEQTQKLEDLGFQWEIAEIESDRWEARFQELKEFKEEHGHCDVPRKHPGGLGSWVNKQRHGGKEWSQHHNAEQAQKLEELGFRWETAKICSWEERFQRLREFKEEHGHCGVPKNHPRGLGNWVEYQRSKRGSLCRDAGQTQKLEELGLRLRQDFKKLAKAAEETKASSPITQGDNEQESNTCALPARTACGAVMVKQTRQQMQAAAARGDYILAGKLQETLTRLITLRQEMQQAAQRNDFILAGHLQTQLNACIESISKKKSFVVMSSGHEPYHSESGALWI